MEHEAAVNSGCVGRYRAGVQESINATHKLKRRPGCLSPPENTYCLIFLNYFRREVNLVSSVIVAAEEDPEP